jgi:hypothetical protein
VYEGKDSIQSAGDVANAVYGGEGSATSAEDAKEAGDGGASVASGINGDEQAAERGDPAPPARDGVEGGLSDSGAAGEDGLDDAAHFSGSDGAEPMAWKGCRGPNQSRKRSRERASMEQRQTACSRCSSRRSAVLRGEAFDGARWL